jgi:ATP-binding cassette subfamily A (ABC1) protein 3
LEDPAYVACVVASGLFSPNSCALVCKDLYFPSTSCCNALTKATQCTATQSVSSICKAAFDETLSSAMKCSLSAPTIGVIVLTSIAAVIGIVVAVLILIAKRKGKMIHNPLNKWVNLMRNISQTRVLVWKNMLLLRKHPFRTLFEIFLPLFLVSALVILANLDVILDNVNTTESQAQWNNNQAMPLNSPLNMMPMCIQSFETLFSEGEPTETTLTFYTSGQPVLGMFFILSYLRFVPSLTSKMVLEKEKKITEGMRMMGLHEGPLLISWYLTGFIQYTPLALFMALELHYGNVFPMAFTSTLFLFFTAFGLAIVSFCNVVSVFFNKSKTAAIASVLGWVVAFLPFYFVQSKSNASQYAASLCAPTAFAHGINYLIVQAQRGTGAYYAIAEQRNPIGDTISVGAMSWMLLLDSLWMLGIGWYLQQIVPQEFGVQKPWNFLFKPEYRLDVKPRHNNRLRFETVGYSGQNDTEPNVEKPTQELQVKERNGECIQVCGLRKVFSTEDGEKVAVNNLSVTMYAGQITALLGHNGAGKSTTISMLTGLYPPTKGTAYIYGKTITEDMDLVRMSMGVCPQHDVLYDELTVVEHLQLYAALKNLKDPAEAIQSMIVEVGLTEKQHVMSKKLSGGQKRKLSVAIALIGQSQVVFLDEPTSGMDPYSRR